MNRSKSWVTTLSTGIVALSLTSCATIISGTTQSVTFDSNPQGANVSIDGRVIGKTPITAPLKRAPNRSLQFSKDGYKTLSTALRTGLNGWFWGNILFGGLFGSTTDGASGAITQYSPDHYLVTLEPESATPLESSTLLSPRQQAKAYIVSNYKELSTDIQKGSGDHLSTLFVLLHVPVNQKNAAADKIRALWTEHIEVAEFANKTIDFYLN